VDGEMEGADVLHGFDTKLQSKDCNLVLRGGQPPLRKFLEMRALLAFSKTVAVFAFKLLNAT
jgi:hypothetical protein